jgi:hypothetical protein
LVELGRDEWVAYEFTVTEPAGLTVTVGLVGAARLAGADGLAGQRALPSVALDDTAVPLSAAGSGTAAVSAPGRHVLRVTGTAPATQFAWLELTAPLGRNGYLRICGAPEQAARHTGHCCWDDRHSQGQIGD